MNKVLIVDDHPVIRLSLRMLLIQEGFEVVGEADNGLDAVSGIKKLQPNFVILDLGIPQLDGFGVIQRVKALNVPVSILVFTAQDSYHLVMRCIQAGAQAYVRKTEEIGELVRGLRATQSGYNFFPSWTAEQPLLGDEVALLKLLSQREMNVFYELIKGSTNKAIALSMGLSDKTVSTYKTRVLEKLNAGNLVELIMVARRCGLVEGS
ncbi:response regulator transcription factor [Pseudomonas arsenicoxydans]|uniref:DNA-binding response regulator n=1 Tax=Pseudomonas arsenicoxydans TaxID=702115 RepID=A0A502GVP6_9PSED|nr:response regulator transcription factor [Pseudomonas arsenicoxydans]TPG65695.1 DNA-binding response regulator [Pseudomonas arsenicoxydans]